LPPSHLLKSRIAGADQAPESGGVFPDLNPATGDAEGAKLLTGRERIAEGALARGNFMRPAIFEAPAMA
jgi:hypothetical protein